MYTASLERTTRINQHIPSCLNYTIISPLKISQRTKNIKLFRPKSALIVGIAGN
jgi:hypothetical protein